MLEQRRPRNYLRLFFVVIVSFLVMFFFTIGVIDSYEYWVLGQNC
jgi:hypothetical protein